MAGGFTTSKPRDFSVHFQVLQMKGIDSGNTVKERNRNECLNDVHDVRVVFS